METAPRPDLCGLHPSGGGGVGACPFRMRDRCGCVSAVWDCARRAYVSDSASWRADLSGMGAGLLGYRLPVFGVGRAQLLGLEGVRPGSFSLLPGHPDPTAQVGKSTSSNFSCE